MSPKPLGEGFLAQTIPQSVKETLKECSLFVVTCLACHMTTTVWTLFSFPATQCQFSHSSFACHTAKTSISFFHPKLPWDSGLEI